MNKKIIAILVLLVVVVVIVGVIGFNHKAKAPEVSNINSTTTSTNSVGMAVSSSNSGGLSVVISTSTTEKYSGSSFSFDYPGSWSVFSAKPLLMTNFYGRYKTDGTIPAGGAQLAVVTTSVSGSAGNIMTTELMSAIGLTTSTVSVNNVSCTKATYQAHYGVGAVAQNVSLYCLRAGELWKIYLSYPANDPAEKTDLSTFARILSSMKFL